MSDFGHPVDGVGGSHALMQHGGPVHARPIPGLSRPGSLGYHGFGLHWLDLSGNRLQDAGAAAVVRALTHNNTVLALDLSANAIGKVRGGPAVVEFGCELREPATMLRVGWFDPTHPYATHACALSTRPRGSRRPQATQLTEALCGHDGLLANNATLRGLHLAANSLGSAAVVRLLTTLASIRRNTLTLGRASSDEPPPRGRRSRRGGHGDDSDEDGFGSGRLEPPGASRSFSLGKTWVKGLFSRLTGGPSAPVRVVSVLRTLDLRANGLSSEAVTAALVKVVEHNRSLRELLLQGNRLSEECGMKLCIASLRNPQLWYLRLAGNHNIRAKARALAGDALAMLRAVCLPCALWLPPPPPVPLNLRRIAPRFASPCVTTAPCGGWLTTRLPRHRASSRPQTGGHRWGTTTTATRPHRACLQRRETGKTRS